jgi:homoserine kinase
VIVRVPASSANLGPGFDSVGLALSLSLTVQFDASADGSDGSEVEAAEETHPAVVAFRRLGGQGSLAVRSPIPMGRGLGFSGAARVGGLVAAVAQREGVGFHLADAYGEILQHASELEGHADNVAASLHGGVVAAAAGRAVTIPLAFDPAIVVWVPFQQTSTDHSRRSLPLSVPFADAVFNVGRTALLVAALASGDSDALRAATDDRLHQDARFAAVPASARAMHLMVEAGAWCGWLSGSGPTVAAMCAIDQADAIAAVLDEADGAAKVLRIDYSGATVESDA